MTAPDRPIAARLPTAVTGLGALLGLGLLVELALAASGAFPSDAVLPARVLTSLPFVVGLLYAGYRLDRSELPVERYARIGGWTLTGLVGFLLVNLAVMLTVPPATGLVAYGWVRWALSLGPAVGFLLGWFEARAIQREVVSERARVRFERLETRTELLGFLDRLLEEEIAPAADDVADRADRLAADPDDRDPEAVRSLVRRAQSLRAVARHAGLLIDPDAGTLGLEPVNLAAALRDVIADVREETPDATIDLEGTDAEPYVLADRLLGRVFEGILGYAVARTPADPPWVRLTVEPAPDTVTVRAVVPELSLPDGARTGLFEHDPAAGGGHALDLALAGLLLEYYDGEVTTADAGDATVFAVTLRAATVRGPAPAAGPTPAAGGARTTD